MSTEAELVQQLDALQAQLPTMIANNRDGDFWMEFAGVADSIEPVEVPLLVIFHRRINEMLAEHGRYMASIDSDLGG
ncbi:MAG: hypothetical protein ACRER5_02995 [Pseudomonas sp.]